MNKLCPFCNTEIETSLARHIKAEHGEETLRKAMLTDKRNGVPDAQIGKKYGISFSYLERVITQEYGTNISAITRKKSKITQWEPKSFQFETTTVWSFKNRGNWATHDGHYRGNWSPYIPRNLILRYSQPREVVLDYFCGAGTTAVEAKLLGRRYIARDINPDALALAKENLDFQLRQNVPSGDADAFAAPELALGDARDLSSIETDSIDLICSHPPYAGIISYSANKIEGDLSTLSVPGFLAEMQKVARESYRVLKPRRQCAILIGDSRKFKRIVPIGFLTIRAFLNAGFKLRELIIKRQHNCKTTGFWYSNSIRYNFLLLAHEFLPVFEKPAKLGTIAESRQLGLPALQATHEEAIDRHEEAIDGHEEAIDRIEREQLETTSVWIFPIRQMQAEIRRNLLGRFAKGSGSLLEIDLEKADAQIPEAFYPLAHIRCCSRLNTLNHFELLDKAVEKARRHLSRDGFCVIETRDFRQDGILVPMGLLTFEHLDQSGLELREIVIVTSEENQPFELPSEGHFGISHKYLLIYRKP
jgi:DNA modification methylase